MKLTINNKDYNIKYTIRGLFIFEQITGKPFELRTVLDNYIFLYSLLLANNPDNPIQWDEFIDALDSDKNLLEQLMEVVREYQNKDNLFSEDASDGEKKSFQ